MPLKSTTQAAPTPSPAKQKKSEETRARILAAALATFRERGFERATMREIATAAEVASGAAYYYFPSKEAIVMAFYDQAQTEMHAELTGKLSEAKTFEARLRAIILEKLNYFAPNRKLLGALTAHTDPEHPLSPFSAETQAIREADLAFFEAAVKDSGIKLSKDVQPYLPRLLWMYQMGLLLFWVYDRSPAQRRTQILFDQTVKMLVVALRLASIPILRPINRIAGELLRNIYEE